MSSGANAFFMGGPDLWLKRGTGRGEWNGGGGKEEGGGNGVGGIKRDKGMKRGGGAFTFSAVIFRSFFVYFLNNSL
jgi:hypothetical protein